MKLRRKWLHEINEIIAMCGRASVLRILAIASVLCSFAVPVSAAGMGGFSMGGMGLGMVGVGGVGNAAGVGGAKTCRAPRGRGIAIVYR